MHHTTIQTQGQADSATEFVVLSPSDFQNDGNGFWSNNEGWTTLEHAQRYDSTDIVRHVQEDAATRNQPADNGLQAGAQPVHVLVTSWVAVVARLGQGIRRAC